MDIDFWNVSFRFTSTSTYYLYLLPLPVYFTKSWFADWDVKRIKVHQLSLGMASIWKEKILQMTLFRSFKAFAMIPLMFSAQAMQVTARYCWSQAIHVGQALHCNWNQVIKVILNFNNHMTSEPFDRGMNNVTDVACCRKLGFQSK